MEKTIFDKEQQHLSETYQKLVTAEGELEQGLTDLDAKAAEEKNDILTNIRYDTADDEVLMESYGEIQNWNHYIDSYNMKYGLMKEKLSQVKMLLEAPYFARVRLQFAPDEEPEDYYIGRSSYSENGYDQLIVDWRSPIAETYYNQENGKTSYQVDGRTIPVDLQLRRQFDLQKDQLRAYFDTQLAIEDPLLLQSLSHQRSDKMQAITTTIQKEQNAIIRYPDVPVMLVNGIAGSGKTSVLLQRIAYLFYRKRKTLRPENVYLLTLNPVFRDYIDEVLPDLGEKNPNTLTWTEFLHMVHDPIDNAGLSTEAASLREIDEKLPSLRLEAEDLKPIMQKKSQVLGRDEILKVIREHDGKIPTGVRLIQVAADELADAVRKSLRIREKQEARRRLEEAEGEDVSGETALLKDSETEEAVEAEETSGDFMDRAMESISGEEESENPGDSNHGKAAEDRAELRTDHYKQLTVSEDASEKEERSAEIAAEKIAEGYADSEDFRVLETGRGDSDEPEYDQNHFGGDKETGYSDRAGEGVKAGRFQESNRRTDLFPENISENAGYRGSGKERQDLEKSDRELQNNYGGAFGQTQDCGWLDIDHIGQRLLGKSSLTSIEWFYLKMALTGECSRNAEYVCIDEVQDYTEAQLMVLKRYFPNAHFMLLGDEFQSIREGTVSFRRIQELFGGKWNGTTGAGSKGTFAELPLLTSYRSTPEITALFAGLLPEEQKLKAQSVQREGTKPVIRAFEGDTEKFAAVLRAAVAGENGSNDAGNSNDSADDESTGAEKGLTAVICADRKSLRKIQRMLPDLPVVGGDKSLPKSGAFLITLAFAKGLEFDHVILPDADEATYGTDKLSRHRLYTAVSRATKEVTIFAEGKLTELLMGI